MSDEANTQELHRLPLHDWHCARGARLVPFAGYEMPIQYSGEFGGIIAEHEWTRASASLFDVSHMGQLIVSGEGAGSALEALLPSAIARLTNGRMRYSFLLDENGGILDDLIVTRSGEDFLLVVNGATKWDDIAHLREHLPDEVTLHIAEDRALLALQGPKAAEALDRLMPGVSRLSFLQAGEFDWGPARLGISRSGYTGEDGFEISVPSEQARNLADALTADELVRPAGLGARDTLRLEAGLPLYGHDLTPETDPLSAGLGFAIPRSRREVGGWMGHEAVVRIEAAGPERRRVGLLLKGRLPAREGATVHAGDQQVGTVTSGGYSPTLGHPIAMAYVAAEHAREGTDLEIEVRGRRLPARIAPLPFVPHNYVRKGA